MTALHAAARVRGWRVGALHWNKYPMSFHWAALETEQGPVALLVHADRPVAAMTPGEPQYMALTFIDDAAFARGLAESGAPFALLAAADLGRGLTVDDDAYVRALGKDFAANMTYWRPRTVGDVVFNWWD